MCSTFFLMLGDQLKGQIVFFQLLFMMIFNFEYISNFFPMEKLLTLCQVAEVIN